MHATNSSFKQVTCPFKGARSRAEDRRAAADLSRQPGVLPPERRLPARTGWRQWARRCARFVLNYSLYLLITLSYLYYNL